MTVQREQLEADVLIVGAGPAGLSCALHLANLIKKHNESGANWQLSTENIYVLEKGREVGAHQLSGAIMNPKALAELVPDFEKSAPLDTPVTDDAALFFTQSSSIRFPITPPPFQNKGNYVVSLNKIAKWLGGLVEKSGVNLFTQFGGAELIYENNGIAGVITEDKGVDKNGKPKDNYTPGYELRAKVTVLAEGTRGSLTKQLVEKYKLDNINPQTYSIGIKELWDVQPGRIQPGYVAHTLGWPVATDMYGGGWIYGLSNNRVSIGLVIGLEYADPQFDPHEAFQKWKTHPHIKKILDGGKLVRYGAKSLPAGGWYSMPRNYVDGGLIIGDSGSFLDSQRLKGIHMAIKSGMLAAETIFDALKAGDTSAQKRSAPSRKKSKPATSKKNSGPSAISISHSNTDSTAASSTPACNSSPADAASSIRCAPKPATSTITTSTAIPRPRASKATANSPSIASPTSITPARATKKISPAIFTSTISTSAPPNAPSSTATRANISAPPPSTNPSSKPATLN